MMILWILAVAVLLELILFFLAIRYLNKWRLKRMGRYNENSFVW